MKKEILKRLAKVADQLESEGFEKHATDITNVMIKISSDDESDVPTPSNIADRGSDYNKNKDKNKQEKMFMQIISKWKNMSEDDKKYFFAKGLAQQYGIKDPQNFANNFMAFVRQRLNF